jgi:hypothetical protein
MLWAHFRFRRHSNRQWLTCQDHLMAQGFVRHPLPRQSHREAAGKRLPLQTSASRKKPTSGAPCGLRAASHHGSNQQMFGAKEQDPHGRQCYQQATGSAAQFSCAANWRDPLRGSVAGLSLKLNMSCIYSSACVYGLAALAVGISSIPLLFVLWRVIKAPIRTRDLVFLGLLALIFLIPSASELIGPWVTNLIYILAGVGR